MNWESVIRSAEDYARACRGVEFAQQLLLLATAKAKAVEDRWREQLEDLDTDSLTQAQFESLDAKIKAAIQRGWRA